MIFYYNYMKRFFTVLMTVTVMFTVFSCDDDDEVNGIPSSLSAPTGLSVSSESYSLTLSWDEVKNATGYTIEYKVSTASEYYVQGSTSETSYTISGLAASTTYDVRVKATVASVSSDYTQTTATTLEGEDNENVTITVSAELLASTSSTLSFQWTASDWEDADSDMAMISRAQLYTDEDCTNLVVAWSFEGSSVTTVGGESAEIFTNCDYPSFLFSGLDAGTTYYFVVTLEDVDGNEGESEPLAATTSSFSPIEIGTAGSASAGDTILAEDFGELTLGGDYVLTNRAPGFSSDDASSLTSQPVPSGEQPGDYVPVISSNDESLFGTLSGTLSSTRLSTWGAINEGSDNSYVRERPGYIRLGNSNYRGTLTTPPLTSLSGLATLTVNFKAAAYFSGSNVDGLEAAVFTVLNGSIDDDNVVTGTVSQVGSASLSDDGSWTECSVTVSNVTPLMRIGIGTPDRSTAGSEQSRIFIDDVSVELVSYGGSISVSAPTDLVLTPATSSISATWTASDGAEAYVVEYRKTSDSDYTVVDFDGLAYTTGTYAVIADLQANEEYEVRVKAGPYIESDYVSATATTVLSIPSTISTAADFVLFLTYLESDDTGTYSLGADIDMSGITLTEGLSDFAGTLDGSGYSITNLTSSVPIFESIASSGTVKNLTLDSSCSFAPSDYIFGPVARINNGTISWVTNNAAVSYTYNPDSVSELALIAGIAGMSYGSITACTNNGSVSVTSSGTVKGGVAGVAAYLSADMEDCVNNGNITQTALYAGYTSTYPSGTSKNTYPCVGGLVAYGASGFSMTGCSNSGTVTMSHTAIESASSSERLLVGGIVGNAAGAVTSCNNSGDVNVNTVTSDRESFATSYMLCVGGVAGGDFYVSNTSSYISCTNSGTVTVDTDAYGSYSRMGTVVGFAGAEGQATHYVTSCVNTGEFVLKGAGKAYIGGIAGGSSTLTDCTSQGKVTIDGAASTTEVGGLIGYHNAQSMSGNAVDCTITVKCALTSVGGLIGRCNNTAKSISAATSVKAVITDTSGSNDSTNTGLIVGNWVGTSKSVTIGSSGSPIAVSGSVLGTTLTSGNYSSYLSGSKYYSESTKTVYAEYGE